MNKKKCELCGYISEENIEKCPTCDGEMVEIVEEEVQESVIQDSQEDATPVQADEVSENAEQEVDTEAEVVCEEPAKSNKTLKIVCAVMAVVLLVVVGAYFLIPSSGPAVFNVSSFSVDDLGGKLVCDTMGMYYEFTPGEVTVDVVVDVPVEETSGSDAAALSDAATSSDAEVSSSVESASTIEKTETKTESRTFDGRCLNGFTEEYIDSVIAREYIAANNLQEEFQAFVEENGIMGDGVEEYIKTKGITKEEIDSVEGAQELREEGASYTTDCYFDYDEENKVITIYDLDGRKLETLLVKREGLVAESGFMAGKTKTGKPFDSTLTMRVEEYGVTQTLLTYKDGNFVIKIEYDDESLGGGESVAGTYEVNGNTFIMEANGQKLPYVILKDGIAAYIFTK